EMADIFDAAGRKVVEQNDVVAAIKKRLREMRTNETGAAGDQIAQRASLQGLGIILAIAGDAMGNGLGIFFMRRFRRLLRAISIRIGIIAVGIVIVRGAGVHGIEDHAEDAALDAAEQVARASESFLGCGTTPNDEKYAVGLHGKNYRVCGSQDGRRIDDNKLVLGAALCNGFNEPVGGE